MKNKKLLYGILIASLAANLFFAGMGTVLLWKGGPPRPHMPPDQFNMMAAREVLDPEYQDTIDKIWRDFRKESSEDFRAVFQLRKEMQDILAARNFDQEKFEATYLKLQENGQNARLAFLDVLREITEVLPPDQRQKYFSAGMDPKNRRPPMERPIP